MDREANLTVPSRNNNNPDTSSSSSSFSSSSSPPDFLRHAQAAFKRHRPLGTMQSSSIGPRRTLLPLHKASRTLDSNVGPTVATKKSQDVEQGHKVRDLTEPRKIMSSAVGEAQEDASITPPSLSGTINKTFDESFNPYDAHKEQPKPVIGSKRVTPRLCHYQSRINLMFI